MGKGGRTRPIIWEVYVHSGLLMMLITVTSDLLLARIL